MEQRRRVFRGELSHWYCGKCVLRVADQLTQIRFGLQSVCSLGTVVRTPTESGPALCHVQQEDDDPETVSLIQHIMDRTWRSRKGTLESKTNLRKLGNAPRDLLLSPSLHIRTSRLPSPHESRSQWHACARSFSCSPSQVFAWGKTAVSTLMERMRPGTSRAICRPSTAPAAAEVSGPSA